MLDGEGTKEGGAVTLAQLLGQALTEAEGHSDITCTVSTLEKSGQDT